MWQGIEGHDEIVDRFRQSLERGRLASTFLFVGPPGIGKRSFALKLAQALLCQTEPAERLAPCGHCPGCVQVLSQTHPDLTLISKPADKSFIPLAVFIGEDERRMREGLCHAISLKPFMGGRKIAIIDDADFLNEESANCLLKTLEEPPPRSILILIGSSADKQLPTIRSRCQTVRFRPLEPEAVARLLVGQGLVSDPAEAERLAEFSEGSLERAMELADADLWSFRQNLLARLARTPLESVSLGRELVAFVDEAGTQASARRARLRQVIGFAVEYYRQLLRALSGLPANGDAELCRAVAQAQARSSRDPQAAAKGVERSLEALSHLERNVHQATLVETWLDDLADVVH